MSSWDEDPAGEYVVAQEPYWGFVTVTQEEHALACERMESWLTKNEPDGISIEVRPVRNGECSGTYYYTTSGNLQILGYTIPIPEEISALVECAWMHACETWEDDDE